MFSLFETWPLRLWLKRPEVGEGKGRDRVYSGEVRGIHFVLPIPSQTKWGTDSPYSGPDWLHKSFFSPETPPSPVQDSGKWTKPYPNTRGQMVQSMIFNFRQGGLSKRVRDVACTPYKGVIYLPCSNEIGVAFWATQGLVCDTWKTL